jgi:hypothetical protein
VLSYCQGYSFCLRYNLVGDCSFFHVGPKAATRSQLAVGCLRAVLVGDEVDESGLINWVQMSKIMHATQKVAESTNEEVINGVHIRNS